MNNAKFSGHLNYSRSICSDYQKAWGRSTSFLCLWSLCSLTSRIKPPGSGLGIVVIFIYVLPSFCADMQMRMLQLPFCQKWVLQRYQKRGSKQNNSCCLFLSQLWIIKKVVHRSVQMRNYSAGGKKNQLNFWFQEAVFNKTKRLAKDCS